ncbi:ImmA/IrrE family metallo-endopeptidase [Virgisporangium aurantiacum]|uniref:ImmA/IrrE family metallo-endopeptidase n=1 Tax=Virgisporangium aurantiacum TaxID=175570 RepID=UPI00194ECEEF|nr:ImmA/IrrE family metallo-endopeptidase [Virgisporangium aurantiacum]
MRPEAWSAALVPDGTGMYIVENTAHQPERRRSNIAHEMAHVVLEHTFGHVLIGGDATSGGCVNAGDRRQEEEAAELGAELGAVRQSGWLPTPRSGVEADR